MFSFCGICLCKVQIRVFQFVLDALPKMPLTNTYVM